MRNNTEVVMKTQATDKVGEPVALFTRSVMGACFERFRKRAYPREWHTVEKFDPPKRKKGDFSPSPSPRGGRVAIRGRSAQGRSPCHGRTECDPPGPDCALRLLREGRSPCARSSRQRLQVSRPAPLSLRPRATTRSAHSATGLTP